MESKLISDFVELVKVDLADNLKSAVLYGSVAQGIRQLKFSDVNILLITGTLNINDLRNLAKIKAARRFSRISPLMLTKSYIESSLDTFPIEFLDIKEKYIILWGEDCLKDLNIALNNLRHQCEWELKSKIIQMQRFCVNSRRLENKQVKNFFIGILPSLGVIFKNILRLKGVNLETSRRKEIFAGLAPEFGLNSKVLDRLLVVSEKNYKAANSDFEDLYNELNKLAQALGKI